jgi:hypothetical protein
MKGKSKGRDYKVHCYPNAPPPGILATGLIFVKPIRFHLVRVAQGSIYSCSETLYM